MRRFEIGLSYCESVEAISIFASNDSHLTDLRGNHITTLVDQNQSGSPTCRREFSVDHVAPHKTFAIVLKMRDKNWAAIAEVNFFDGKKMAKHLSDAFLR